MAVRSPRVSIRARHPSRLSPGQRQLRDTAVRTEIDALNARAWENLKHDLDVALAEAQDAGRRAADCAYEAGNAAAALTQAGIYYHRGDYPQSLAFARRALAGFMRSGDPGRQAAALQLLGNIHVVSRRPARAKAYFERALPLARAAADHHREAQILGNLAHWHWLREEFAPATERLQEALILARRHHNRLEEGYTRLMLGSVYSSQGDEKRALREYKLSLAARRDANYTGGMAMALRNIGESLCKLRRPREALAPLAEALRLSRRCGDRRTLATTLCTLAEARIALGEVTGARRCAQRALTAARAQGDMRAEAEAQLSLGRLAAACDRPGAARAHWQLAKDGARECEDFALEKTAAALFAGRPAK